MARRIYVVNIFLVVGLLTASLLRGGNDPGRR
jgi:hypothetical protein